MVWKCCVPQCKSGSKMPIHRFPVDRSRAEHWLTAIGKTELIGAPKEQLAKLRICTEHFPEEMILPYGLTRRLNDNAVPSLNLFISNTVDSVHNCNNLGHNLELVENVPNKSDLMPVPIGEDNVQHVPRRPHDAVLQRRLRTQRKMLHKRNA